MSKWFPDVRSPEGAREATKAGAVGALTFAATTLLGLVLILTLGHFPGQQEVDAGYALGGAAAELVLALACAWRFWVNRGLLIGPFTLALFLFEVFGKLANGHPGGGWFIFYAVITIALVNGLRGAWAFRKFGRLPAASLHDTFR